MALAVKFRGKGHALLASLMALAVKFRGKGTCFARFSHGPGSEV